MSRGFAPAFAHEPTFI